MKWSIYDHVARNMITLKNTYTWNNLNNLTFVSIYIIWYTSISSHLEYSWNSWNGNREKHLIEYLATPENEKQFVSWYGYMKLSRPTCFQLIISDTTSCVNRTDTIRFSVSQTLDLSKGYSINQAINYSTIVVPRSSCYYLIVRNCFLCLFM